MDSSKKMITPQDYKYGWYSNKQFKTTKTFYIYKNMEGIEIHVTVVSNTQDHKCKFDDMNFVGKVKEFVKKISTDDN